MADEIEGRIRKKLLPTKAEVAEAAAQAADDAAAEVKTEPRFEVVGGVMFPPAPAVRRLEETFEAFPPE